MAALTGQERGLPPGSYLNDTVDEGPDVAQVSVVWQPYEDKVSGSCRFVTLASVPTKHWSEGAPAYGIPLTFCCTVSFSSRRLACFCTSVSSRAMRKFAFCNFM